MIVALLVAVVVAIVVKVVLGLFDVTRPYADAVAVVIGILVFLSRAGFLV